MMFDDEYFFIGWRTPFWFAVANSKAVYLMRECALSVTIAKSNMGVAPYTILPYKKMVEVVTFRDSFTVFFDCLKCPF